MNFSAKELRSNPISRFLFRHVRYSSVVLSTGRRINFYNNKNGTFTSSIVYVGQLSNFEKIEIAHVEEILTSKTR